MTERLYYTDPTLLEFMGKILSVDRDGDNWKVWLDRSAFYPTSGGQMNDLGELGDSQVIDVVEVDGDVVHICDSIPGDVGSEVTGAIDASRRFRHRQSHTAQHILSQSFVSLFALETVSVHLGQDYSAIELPAKEITEDQLIKAQQFANTIIEQNMAVEVMMVPASEAEKLPLRKVPTRVGTLRIIKIGEFDWSACGGTHCLSTAEVGLIQVIGVEKLRGNSLVKFLAGEMAKKDYAIRFATTDQLSRKMTCAITDIAAKVDKLESDNKQMRAQIASLQKELLPLWIESLAERREEHGSLRFVSAQMMDVNPSMLNPLASGAADKISGVVVLLGPGRLVVASSESSGVDAGGIVNVVTDEFNLRGGGNSRMAQIGNVTSEQFEGLADRIIQLAAGD